MGWLVVLLWSLGVTFAQAQLHCPGGLYPPDESGAQQVVVGTPGRWGQGPHTIVTWSFVESDDRNSGESGVVVLPIVDGQGGFPARARAIIREAFAEWARVADIRFEERTAGVPGQIRVGAHAFGGSVLGHAFFPGTSDIAGDVHLASNESFDEQTFLATATHEIGHALGLMHILDESDLDGVIMYAVIGAVAERLTRKDIGYLQSLYGPPIPLIRSADNTPLNTALRVQWEYPTEPQDSATPTRRHLGTISPSSTSGTVQVRINTTTDLQPLRNYAIQSTRLQQQTLSDGAEDNETRLFDDTLQDGANDPDDTLWVRDNRRVFAGARAYRIEPANLMFRDDYRLPQRSAVEATATSLLRFQRAYFFTADQEIRYLLSVNGGTPLPLMTENGSNEFRQADSPYTARVFDLSPYAGQQITVIFEYHHDTFWENDDNGVSIDTIELVNVIAESGTPRTHSSSIDPAATFFDLTDLQFGLYNIRMRTIFSGAEAAEFSEARRASFMPQAGGDVNDDGEVTPADVLCTFQFALALQTSPECRQARANVKDAERSGITAADALCIFRHFLGRPSCLDATGDLRVKTED